MIAKNMQKYVEGNSVIRAMFEEGKKLAKIYGPENVYDYSLGNPNLAPPETLKNAIIDILNEEKPTLVHGYMNNAGYEDVRATVANNLNKRFQTNFNEKNILMTVGAAGGLNVTLKTLIEPEDEVVVFAPYFVEYNNYVANFNGKVVVISPNTETFQPNLDEFAGKLTKKTKAVIVNNPNNPTGVVYGEETIQALAKIMEDKQKEFGTDIYLIADEPYRELAYDGVNVPYLTKYYANTVVGYSWSKSLSLPGERIGYLVMPTEMADFDNFVNAATIANRILGFVNAPSLIQRAVARCIDESADVAVYDKNRQALYNGLLEAGYECAKPEGAFYLWVKSPMADEKEFCKIAKDDFQLLLVQGSAFQCPGYFRLAYCVSYEQITKSLPQFKALMQGFESGKYDK